MNEAQSDIGKLFLRFDVEIRSRLLMLVVAFSVRFCIRVVKMLTILSDKKD